MSVVLHHWCITMVSITHTCHLPGKFYLDERSDNAILVLIIHIYMNNMNNQYIDLIVLNIEFKKKMIEENDIVSIGHKQWW